MTAKTARPLNMMPTVRLQLRGIWICHCEAVRPWQSPKLWEIVSGTGILPVNPPIPPFTKGGIKGGFADACPTIHRSQ
jgi:hypothetical protein